MRFVVAVAVSTIIFVLPTFAQQKNTVDPNIAQQIRFLAVKYDEAMNKHDADAIAALYTEDGVRASDWGTFRGRQSSKNRMENTTSTVGRSATFSPR